MYCTYIYDIKQRTGQGLYQHTPADVIPRCRTSAGTVTVYYATKVCAL